MNWYIIRLVLFFSLFLSSAAYGFNVPERLEFGLDWVGINAGSAVLKINNSDGTFVIELRAVSNKFISFFYRVDDRVKCIVDGDHGKFGYSINYRLKSREGRHRKDKEVAFDQAAGKAVYMDHKKGSRSEYGIPGNTYDPLSAFYYVRRLDLKVGIPVNVNVFDSKKMWNVKVQVLRREKVKVPAGVFDTIVIKPILKSEGIFRRKGAIYIWLTNDGRNIPVKLKTKAPIGYITAELTGGNY
ncbi:hypothetical protein BMS3Abin07_00297 [bacterium BMS3Abin07]|nr:hypothetical protein BMS3Abin07_00297 [bacterium BMS3Abin07]GBE31798.1 hypothetical protein BMS3Bbin05_00701 [bacterium BMS3Bbin05]HDO21872.1 DUF3108 domain-containing protein [Nitrospirota bacterium]HDZ88604.1 DUF3108 domain-containing protein [Nitrospirota bacterium]